MMLSLGKAQSDIFLKDNIGYMNAVIVLSVPFGIMDACYNVLTRTGKMMHIEVLPEQQKIGIYEMAKDISAGRLDREGLIKLSHLLLTLEYFLQ